MLSRRENKPSKTIPGTQFYQSFLRFSLTQSVGESVLPPSGQSVVPRCYKTLGSSRSYSPLSDDFQSQLPFMPRKASDSFKEVHSAKYSMETTNLYRKTA